MKKTRVIGYMASLTLLAGAISASAADNIGDFGYEAATGVDSSFQQWFERGKQLSQAPSLATATATATARDQASCNAAAAFCVVAQVGFGLGCGAAVISSAGSLSAACVAAWNAAGTACVPAVYYCSGGSGTPPVRRLKTVGDWTDDGAGPDVFKEDSCPYPTFVDRVEVKWDYGRVVGMVLRCNKNEKGQYKYLGFGYVASNAHKYTCPAGQLMAGLLLQAGLEIDAAGGICRKVGATETTTFVDGIWGGSGGSRQDRVCAPGTELVGAKAQVDGGLETNPNLLGIEPICR